MNKTEIMDIIDSKKEKLATAADNIWETPELRFATKKSVQEHYKVLEEEDFVIQKGVAGMKHAYIATFGSGKPVIGILGEYDALSNLSQIADLAEEKALEKGANGHGCGHNLLGIGSVAGAIGVKEYLKQTGQNGTIKLFGCPAEEGGCGKSYMAREGVFDDLDLALSWHPGDQTKAWGNTNLAVYHVYYNFHGKAAHAAGSPELGRSALDAAELMNIGVQYLREHIMQEARIHYAYKDAGGTSPNVVQSSTSLFYYVRAPKMEQATEIFERVNKIAQGAALMTETELEIKLDSACLDYIPNQTFTTLMHKNLELLTPLDFSTEEIRYEQNYFDTVPENVKGTLFQQALAEFPEKSIDEIKNIASMPINSELYPLKFTPEAIGSTDVGDVSWVVPTAQVHIACEPHGTSAHSWQWVANGKSSVAHKGILTAGKALALTAIDAFEQPEYLQKAKEEHLATLGEKTYQCGIPSTIQPEE